MKKFFSELFRHVFVSILIVVLISLTAVNLTLANIAGETCGAIHPHIFNLNISMESERGLSISSIETAIPEGGTSEEVNPKRGISGDDTNINANIQFTGEPLDTFLRIYNTNNELLAWNDDFIDFFAGIDPFQVSQPTEIIIEVGTFADSYRGVYTLYVVPSAVTDSTIYYDTAIVDPYLDPLASPFSSEEGFPKDINLENETSRIQSAEIEPHERHQYRLTLPPNVPIYIDIFGDESAEPITVADSTSNNESAEEGSQNYLFNRQANIEDEWSACLQYYGYFDGEQFNLSDNGVMRFILFRNTDALQELINLVNSTPEESSTEDYSIQRFVDDEGAALMNFLRTHSPISKRFLSDACNPEQPASIDTTNTNCTVRATVTLSLIGRIVFYVILPIIVILLPVVTVWILRKQNILWWSVMMVLVAAQVMTTALLFIHLSEISGIGALNDFGTGIFGGTITASALAFIGKVIENFSE